VQAAPRFCGACGADLVSSKRAAMDALMGDTVRDRPVQVPQRPSQTAGAHLFGKREPIIDPYIGITLNNRFLIEEKLGEGGFGAVYRGTQEATGRKVALKLLHPEMTRDGNVVERFRREGQVLCSLRDAHTITTYDFDQTSDGTLFIAMELLEGRSLHEVFHREAPIDWRRILKIVAEMCSSLAEAHALGIVHRDLKPENVYLEDRPGNPEFVKILDFGIAKVVRGEAGAPQAPQLTATGQTLGTLEYMSPEQLMGKQLDGRSDIYALGVVAYEMITGRLPFPDAIGPAALITAQLKKTPDVPSVANPRGAIPPAIDRLILKMLAKDKANRYQDASELRHACEQLLATPSGSFVATPNATPAPGASSPRPVSVASGGSSPRAIAGAVSIPPSAAAPSSHGPSVIVRQSIAPGQNPLVTTARGPGPAPVQPRHHPPSRPPEPHPSALGSRPPDPAVRPRPAPRRGSRVWLWGLLLLVAAAGVAAVVMLMSQ
jgi:serine/threonine-protein kinase